MQNNKPFSYNGMLYAVLGLYGVCALYPLIVDLLKLIEIIKDQFA
jgi:hypothetical protein